jgi:hypothetical protein
MLNGRITCGVNGRKKAAHQEGDSPLCDCRNEDAGLYGRMVLKVDEIYTRD